MNHCWDICYYKTYNEAWYGDLIIPIGIKRYLTSIYHQANVFRKDKIGIISPQRPLVFLQTII